MPERARYPIKVYDVRPDEHNSLETLPRLGYGDIEQLQAFYKFEIDYWYGYDRAKAGELFWGVHGFELKAGPAILQPQVRDEDGTPIMDSPGILLFLSWPGAETLPPGVDPSYEARGIAGFTEGKGCVGWGFGGESHIGAGGGPYTVWVSSDPEEATYERRVGSDAVRKLGWWDDHIIPNPIFQVMRKEGGGIPPTPVETEYLVNVAADGTATGYIAFTPGAPPGGTPALGLMRDGALVGHVMWVSGSR